MYRIELASGEETVYRTIEELATAIRHGIVNTRARIYHNATQKWLPIEFHPHYRKALELPVGPSQPADSGPLRAPDFRSSGPQPAVSPAPAAPTQHHAPPTQHHAPATQHYAPPAEHHAPPAQYQSPPAQHHAPPSQYRPAPFAHHHAPAPAPVPHRPARVDHHQAPAPVQNYLPPIPIPPPVPSPALELTRPTFTPPSTHVNFGALEAALALEDPPPPALHEEAPPSSAKSSRSWLRGPITLGVVGIIVIVCTRVVVSAAAPGSEVRPLAETAPRPVMTQRTTSPEPAPGGDREPGMVLTAGPAFSPAIVTSAQAAMAAAPAPAPVKRPAAEPASADSIEAVEVAPAPVDLALPAVPADSLASAATRSDSGAIRRILRAVTSSKPAPIKAAQ